MGTSYVEFRKHGFWARDNVLSGWLTTLIDEMRTVFPSNNWLPPLIRHWEIQREIDGGCMALDLDGFLADDEKRGFVISAGESALTRTSDDGKRTGHLFVALLRGEVKTDESSPTTFDYCSGCITGNPEVSWSRVKMSVLPTNRSQKSDCGRWALLLNEAAREIFDEVLRNYDDTAGVSFIRGSSHESHEPFSSVQRRLDHNHSHRFPAPARREPE